MAKKKIVIDEQEMDLSKIKSVQFTLDLKVAKEDFDKLLKTMSSIGSPDKEGAEK